MARVIRGAGAPRVVPASVVDATTRAAEIERAARERADAIVAEAEASAEAVRDAARQDARLEADEELARRVLTIGRERETLLAGSERELKVLAVAIAERLAGTAFRADPAHVTELARDALTRARRARSIELRVHPDDEPALASSFASESVRVIADASIARGGCLVKSELGVIDARLEARIDAVRRALGAEPA